ncbi:MAG: response regulator [Thermodesulfobacteriota bacterium]
MDRKLIKRFAQDLVEEVENAEEEIFKLANEQADIHAIFRTFHNLKSSTGLLGLEKPQHLCHQIETLLGKVRDKELPASTNLVTLLMRAVDVLKIMLNDVDSIERIDTEFLVFTLANFGQSSQIAQEPEAFLEQEDDEAAMPAARLPRGIRVLVVDDEYIVRRTVKKILANSFSEVDLDFAANGIEAVQAYQLAVADRRPFEVILLDIEMPGKDGYHVLEKIRGLEHELGIDPEVPILMVSAKQRPRNVIAAYKRGCTDYLLKPFREADLVAKMHELLAARAQSGEG